MRIVADSPTDTLLHVWRKRAKYLRHQIEALNVLELSRPAAITTSFVTLGAVKLWFVMNLRDRGTSVLRNDVVRNRWIWAAIVVCVVLLGLAVYLPGLSSVLDTRALGWRAWGVVLALSLVPVVAGQLILGVGRKDKNR